MGGGGGQGGVCSLANYSDAYEETQSNRVSDLRDFVCSLFPKAILFYFYSISLFQMVGICLIMSVVRFILWSSLWFSCGLTSDHSEYFALLCFITMVLIIRVSM